MLVARAGGATIRTRRSAPCWRSWRGARRALLSLATGAGKTFIAVNLLRRIADAGKLRKALFICDRDELRKQASAAFQRAFGADAAAVTKGEDQKNARVLIATYQTLDVASDEADASFLTDHYPPDYFSHIIIDECHRSACGKWSLVLTRNPSAIQIGLTATPRQLQLSAATTGAAEASEDARIAADNIRHFGEPVYEYDISQGIEDGYLAACEIVRRDIFIAPHEADERESGLSQHDLFGKSLSDARTGAPVSIEETRAQYAAANFESTLLLDDRVKAMCHDLFESLRDTGGPEQKTIIFCARDDHADRVAAEMNNLYAAWAARTNNPTRQPYAFKCTAAASGADSLPDLRGAARHHYIATTVDLLTTGVDVPIVRNIVFFKYVKSPISFYQMIGRGTRLDEASDKLMFRVYDYTNATRLFGEEFLSKLRAPERTDDDERPEREPPKIIRVAEGVGIRIGNGERAILATDESGRAMPVEVGEYRKRLAARLLTEAPTLADLRRLWAAPGERRRLLEALPYGANGAQALRQLDGLNDCDLYDMLADLAYGLAPRTRVESYDAFIEASCGWLAGFPGETAAVVRALARQFSLGGAEALESDHLFETPEVVRAGGLPALSKGGAPGDLLRETKERIFAA